MDLPPNSNEGQICSKFANECMKLPSKATLPIASFSKQQYPARERMTSLSLYLSGNKIIVCCHSNSIVYCVPITGVSWLLMAGLLAIVACAAIRGTRVVEVEERMPEPPRRSTRSTRGRNPRLCNCC